MNSLGFYQVDENKAVSETLDGETIVINLESGTYYSLNETASLLWDSIKESEGISFAINKLKDRYIAKDSEIEASVNKTIDFLLEEQLIKESHYVSQNQNIASLSFVGEKKPFIELVVKSYEDMQEILLADPIHDVDEQGWPTLKKN